MTKARSNAVAEAAKGDLSVGSGTNLAGILAVGNNGETLVADSSTTTGLRYQGTFAGGKNLIINGAMTYAQRGTSSTYLSAGQYRLDRWAPYEYQSCNAQQVTTGSTTVPSYYALRAGSTTSAQGASRIAIGQQIESLYAQNFAGQTVTLSYWVKYSAASTPSGGGNAYAQIGTSTAVDPAMSSAAMTALVTNTITNGSLPTTWTKYSITGTLPTNTRTIQIKFQIENTVSTTNANDFYFDITGVQLEVGSVATGFTMAGGTLQGELAACQRYCQVYSSASNNFAGFGVGSYYNTTQFFSQIFFPVEMRVAPSITFSTASAFATWSNGSKRTATAINPDTLTTKICAYYVTTSSATAGDGGWVSADGSTGALMTWSAEL